MRIYVPQTRRIDSDLEQMLHDDGYNDIVYCSRTDGVREYMTAVLGCDAMLIDSNEQTTKLWRDLRNMVALCGIEMIDVANINNEAVIADVVSKHYNVSVSSMRRRGRHRDVTDARKMTAYIMYEAGIPVRRICQFLNKDRGTVNYYIKSGKGFLQFDKKTKSDYRAIKEMINK